MSELTFGTSFSGWTQVYALAPPGVKATAHGGRFLAGVLPPGHGFSHQQIEQLYRAGRLPSGDASPQEVANILGAAFTTPYGGAGSVTPETAPRVRFEPNAPAQVVQAGRVDFSEIGGLGTYVAPGVVADSQGLVRTTSSVRGWVAVVVVVVLVLVLLGGGS